MAIPTGWNALGFTSGRRTYRGNKLVGGVGNSHHLDGTAADFTAPMSALRAMFPNNPILDEGDHRHVGGLSGVPYYGHQGIAGLVNGVDTTAPKGAAPQMPPRTPNFAAMSQVAGGYDPLAPQNPIMQGLAPQTAQQMPPPQRTPQAPMQPPHHKLNAAAIAGILGDALAAYGGQRGVFAPMMAQQRQDESEDNRFQQHLAAQVEMARQKALFDAQQPTDLEQRVATLNKLKPGLGDTYAQNYASNGGGMNVKLFTDPMTGQTYNIGGGQASGPPSKTLPDGRQAWFVNGDWYDNPEGR